ncbi:hypothetical protein GEMRC1_001968 [Eukaryota sp. GEM-RC1]
MTSTSILQEIEDLKSVAASETRSFLRRKTELALADAYLRGKLYKDSLNVISSLLTEVRKLDDKSLQIDVSLLEAKVFTELKNYSKAKASLTAARAASNAIYCPPKQAANLDLQAGILHLEEGDANTAFSYFLEAFTSLDGIEEKETAHTTLLYMLLSKLSGDRPQDIPGVLNDRILVKYDGRPLQGLQKLGKAQSSGSLGQFQQVLDEYFSGETSTVLVDQFDILSDRMLEYNLIVLTKPYSAIEISVIAQKLGLAVQLVERRLAAMIMDGKLAAFLDQNKGVLILESTTKKSNMDELCGLCTGVIKEFSLVTDKLKERSSKIVQM